MSILRTSTLAFALLAAAGIATPAFAQRATDARAKAAAKTSKTIAADAARNARLDAKIAKEAAHDATVSGDMDAKTARQASVAAEDAKNDAVDRTADTMGAVAGARDGINKETAAAEAAVSARAASRAATRAANQSATARAAMHDDDAMASPTVPMSTNASDNAVIATSAPGAMADYRHMTGAGRFHIDTNVLDTNHDGMLTREEASANITLNNQFASVDANADGRIDTGELRGWISGGGLAKNSLPLDQVLAGTGMANAFQMLDLNADGRLTSKEAATQAKLGTRFRALDSNHDGYLSQAEFDMWTSMNGRAH